MSRDNVKELLNAGDISRAVERLCEDEKDFGAPKRGEGRRKRDEDEKAYRKECFEYLNLARKEYS